MPLTFFIIFSSESKHHPRNFYEKNLRFAENANFSWILLNLPPFWLTISLTKDLWCRLRNTWLQTNELWCRLRNMWARQPSYSGTGTCIPQKNRILKIWNIHKKFAFSANHKLFHRSSLGRYLDSDEKIIKNLNFTKEDKVTAPALISFRELHRRMSKVPFSAVQCHNKGPCSHKSDSNRWTWNLQNWKGFKEINHVKI